MNILFIDDEPLAVKQFEQCIKKCSGFNEYHTFTRAIDVLQFAEMNIKDKNIPYAAFLDIELPNINGVNLAVKLKELIPTIQITFITAYPTYALDAFHLDAVGYLLKPYSTEQLQHEIDKLSSAVESANPKEESNNKVTAKGHHVYFKTMPFFELLIDNKIINGCTAKPKELLALLVARNGAEVTRDMAIGCLWPTRDNDEKTGSLFRMTLMRPKQFLNEKDIGDIIESTKTSHFLNPALFETDINKIPSYDFSKRAGNFLTEYSWSSFIQ